MLVTAVTVLASYPAKIRGHERHKAAWAASSGLPVNLATLHRSIIDVTSNTGVLTCSHSLSIAQSPMELALARPRATAACVGGP